MNQLLIHNQKTVLLDGRAFDTAEQFLFEPGVDTPDVDHYITAELEAGDLRDKLLAADVVFIKIALSENYFEYLGLRLAYHIRLSPSLEDKRYLPIIFVGEESYDFLGRTAELSDILFTGGVYLIRDNREAYDHCIKQIAAGKILPLKDNEAFLDKIRVSPPANYQTHHSITNEWSILRWADMAKNIPNEDRERLREQIKTTQTLYFKYLEAKSTKGDGRQSFPKVVKNKELLTIAPSTNNPAKIYYIDDEQGKGWGELFSQFIFKEYTDVGRFAYCDVFPKGEQREDLLKRLKEKTAQLIEEGFNVFIIDLRLCDDDFKNKGELCGFELIKEIKKINKGVQIVIFTASKKAENVNKAADLGVTRYVLKESPEHVLTRKDSYALFQDFSRQLKDAADKSFLATFHKLIQKMKQTTMFASETATDKKDFRASIVSKNGLPDKIFALTEGHTNLFLGEAFLNAFKVLEKICGFYYINGGTVPDKSGKLIDVIIDTGTQRSAEFEFVSGLFPFQTNQFPTTTGVVFKKVMFLKSPSTTNRDNESLTKTMAVLKFRYNIDDAKLKKVIELRYLRSNLAAHDTGNVDTNQRTITRDDVLFLTNLLSEILA
jgi:CheY-like chemotaxis protein